LVVSL